MSNKTTLFNQILFIALLLSGCGSGSGPGATSGGAPGKGADGLRTPVCVVDRFKQPEEPQVKKLDVLFVMDNSNSMNRHWQLMATKIGRLIKALPPGQDLRFAVVLGTIEKFTGVLFSAPGQPKVLDASKLNEAQIIASLQKTFARAMIYENIDWTGAGEALFWSLHSAATAKAEAIQKQGFFRPDAGLNVIFMSDDAEESFPYPSRQIWGLPNKCNWAHHERIRKTFYLPKGIDADSTFAALRRLKGDMPLVTNAFVNITKEDILVDNSMNAHCIYDSPGFGYFDIVKRSNGVLWSIHHDRGVGLEKVARLASSRLGVNHDFHLSKPAALVDPASITASVDTAKVPHVYTPDTNVVHLENAGQPGSSVEIAHCEPVPQHEWSIQNFGGAAAQFTAELHWNTPELATRGKIVYGTDPASLNDVAESAANATAHDVMVSGLNPDTAYYFQAIAKDEFGTEKKSEVLSLRTRPAWAMGPLTGSAARNVAVLLFDTAAHATAGRIVWGLAPDRLEFSTGETRPLNAHRITVDNLEPATTYYFRAIAKDEFGLEQQSNVISLRTVNDWAIVGLSGTASRNSAALSWATPEYPTESEIHYGTDAANLNQVARDGNVAIPHSVNITGLASGTVYFFQAFARDDHGVAKQSGVISLRTVNDWDLGPLSASSTEDTFNVTFATAGYPTSARVSYGLSSDQLTTFLDAGSDSQDHSATATGLNPDTLYYFQAEASDDLGQSRKSAVGSIRTKKVEVPLPEWHLTGFEGAATQHAVNLTWATLEYPTTGRVSYGTTPQNLNKNLEESAPGKTHALTANGLEADTMYFFQLTARDDRGQEQTTGIIAVRTQAEEVPLPVWHLTGFAGTPTKTAVNLAWSTAEYNTTGKVFWGLSPDALNGVVAETGASKAHALSVASLVPNTVYYFQVVARDDRGQEQASAVISVRTLEDPQPTWSIVGFDGTTTSTQANLIWQTPGAATKATIKVGLSATDLSFKTVEVPAFDTTHIVAVTGLSPNTVYFFQVVAVDGSGGTQASGVISKRTKVR